MRFTSLLPILVATAVQARCPRRDLKAAPENSEVTEGASSVPGQVSPGDPSGNTMGNTGGNIGPQSSDPSGNTMGSTGGNTGPQSTDVQSPGDQSAGQGASKNFTKKKDTDIILKHLQLYPENIDYNEKTGRAYISELYKSSVFVWDPKTLKNETIKFGKNNELTGNRELHASGTQTDTEGKYLYANVNDGKTFETMGGNITGRNYLIKYDLQAKKESWVVDLTPEDNSTCGGFQDIALSGDRACVVGTYPGCIKCVTDGEDRKPVVTEFWKSDETDTKKTGMTALVSFKTSEGGVGFLAPDETLGHLRRFDDTKSTKGSPQTVQFEEQNVKAFNGSDGMILLQNATYEGRALLHSSGIDGVSMVCSADAAWKKASRPCKVPGSCLEQGGSPTTAVEIGAKIYSLCEMFGDATGEIPKTPKGNRDEFLLEDITDGVEKCWAQCKEAKKNPDTSHESQTNPSLESPTKASSESKQNSENDVPSKPESSIPEPVL